MKVVVVAPGRLHAFELALQLQKKGMLHQLITGYPKFEVLKYGIQKDKVKSIYLNEIINRLTYKIFKDYRYDYLACEAFDLYNSKTIDTSADAYIIWSSYAEHTIAKIKKHNSNAKIILERGSAHIEVQEEILSAKEGKPVIHPKIIKKELNEYISTDYISIPSIFVKESFIEKGVSSNKLFLNNYGVEISQFPFQFKKTNADKFTVGYVGTLSRQKNIQGLIEAVRLLKEQGMNIHLLLVGPIDHQSFDENLLHQPFIEYVGYQKQSTLKDYYKLMDVFVLNSIQDGFGMVISQALASGIPVIATNTTGGLDIITDGYNGFIIPTNNQNELIDKLKYCIQHIEKVDEMKNNAYQSVRENLTWDAYGERYINFLNSI